MVKIKRRTRHKLTGSFLVLLILSVSLLFAQSTLPTGSWGLSFQQDGAPPVGNAASHALEKYDAAYLGDVEEPVIYLTFDAGYENGLTDQILDTLQKHQVPATFFLVGNYMETEPDLVRRMVEEGHIVGNHTYHHSDMTSITDPATFKEELELTEILYEEITGEKMKKFYRPPQGTYSEENLAMAQSLGYQTVFWSLAYVDWYVDNQPTHDAAYGKLIPRIHNGAVVLLHSTSKTNAEILDELLQKWKDLGFRFASIEELFNTDSAV